MERFLLDTNVISSYFQATLPSHALKLIARALDNTALLSVITQIELLSWKTNKEVEEKIREFIADCFILPIN